MNESVAPTLLLAGRVEIVLLDDVIISVEKETKTVTVMSVLDAKALRDWLGKVLPP